MLSDRTTCSRATSALVECKCIITSFHIRKYYSEHLKHQCFAYTLQST